MKHITETMIKTLLVLLLLETAICVISDPLEIRLFHLAVDLELTSETSANASIGDLDGEGVLIGDKALAPGGIAIGDMNRDGKADIVIGYAATLGSVFFNKGKGTDFQQVRFGDGVGAVYGIALGDLNNDSIPISLLREAKHPTRFTSVANSRRRRRSATGGQCTF